MRWQVSSSVVGGLLCLAVAGCNSKTAEQPKPAADKPTSAANTDPVAAQASSKPDAASDSTDDKPAATNKVQLGSDDLLAGVPGEGPLTAADLQAWLDDPANHEVLEVSLPLGLAAGASQIKGLADNPLTRAKIELGRQLYFDGRLSSDTQLSCASCHDPDQGFAAHTRFGVGVAKQEGNRNSPVAYNRILSDAQFWDGRAKSLEDQAVGPIANPIEMGNTHEGCVECLTGVPGYKAQFEKIFPDGLTIENVGKAIASFERTLVTGPSPYDFNEVVRNVAAQYGDEIDELKEDSPAKYQEYLAAVAGSKAMGEDAKRGRELFFGKANCTACHVGPNLSDEKYHNLGVGMDAEDPDLGRFVVTEKEEDQGAFKTPTIRNVALTAPYMHDGSQKTLEEVVAWYAKGGHPNPHLSEKVKKLDLTDQDQADLVAFMKACTGEFPPVQRGRLPE